MVYTAAELRHPSVAAAVGNSQRFSSGKGPGWVKGRTWDQAVIMPKESLTQRRDYIPLWRSCPALAAMRPWVQLT